MAKKESNGRSCLQKSIQAGIAMGSLSKNMAVWYPVNVKGMVTTKDLKVPHSELAMHQGAAGKEILAWSGSVTRGTARVLYKDKNGCAKYIDGTPTEVMSNGLIHAMKIIRGT